MRRSRDLDALGNAHDFKPHDVLSCLRGSTAARVGYGSSQTVLDLYDAGAAVAEGNLVAALGDSSGLPAAADADTGA